MYSSSSAARIEAHPRLGIFLFLNIEGSSEVDSSTGEKPALLNSKGRQCRSW